MAKMLGKVWADWCLICNAKPGPDCPERSRTKRQAKRAEERQWRREEASDA